MQLRAAAALAIFISISTLNSSHAILFDSKGNVVAPDQVSSANVDWRALRSGWRIDLKYRGVGALGFAERWLSPSATDLIGSDGAIRCTGALIETQGEGDAPAYVLTSGHCYGDEELDARTFLINYKPLVQPYFLLNYFYDVPRTSVVPIKVRRVAYATMKVLDIAVLELEEPLKNLRKMGFVPLAIEPVPPQEEGEPVDLIGVPLEGMKPTRRFLHRSQCKLGPNVNFEWDHYGSQNPENPTKVTYRWKRSYLHTCSMVAGTSGGPLVSRKTGKIVAVNNTFIDETCFPVCRTLDERGGPVLPSDSNVAQDASAAAGCFDAKGYFNLDLPTCGLGHASSAK